MIAAPLANGVHHGQVALGGHIVGDGVSGSKGNAAVALDFFQTVDDIGADFLRRLAAEDIGVDSAEIADAVAVFVHPNGEVGNAVLVGVFGVDVGHVDDVVKHSEQVAAGMEQEGAAGVVYQIGDAAVTAAIAFSASFLVKPVFLTMAAVNSALFTMNYLL